MRSGVNDAIAQLRGRQMGRFLAIAAFGLTACTAGAAMPLQTNDTAAAPSGKPVTTSLGRSSTTISGQPLRLPQGAAEVAAAIIDIPQGGATPIHQHPWSRFVYVERGPVRIINHDTGATLDFQSGQFLPEVVAQWHEGRAPGPGPVRLVVIDVVPPGVNNTVMRP
jgi:quercetin dioxygenase-like cupin family protein